MTKHDNKIALVTGSSRGLGRNIALRLAASGADVIITYRERKDEGATVVAEVEKLGRKAALLQLDVAQSNSFDAFHDSVRQALAETWKRDSFDFLINNAGIDSRATVDKTTEDQFDKLLNVHFKGVFFLTQKLLPVLADGGRIVNTSTGLTRFVHPGYAAYASMKGAVEILTKYMAKELGPRGISVNIVAPGAIETDFTAPGFEHNPGIRDVIAKNTALGRVGVPDDIGGVVDFLCSDGLSVNAQRIEVSGGMFL